MYGYHHCKFLYYVDNALPSGFIGGISLVFETPGRQAEIALFCFAKTMETVWSWLLRRNYVKNVKYGDVFLFGLAIAIIGYYYQHDKESIKPSYQSVMSKLLGDI